MNDYQITRELVPNAGHTEKLQAHRPNTTTELDVPAPPGILKLFPDAMEVFLAWERLRLLYNAVLIGVVLFHLNIAVIILAPFLLEPALVANLCFCAGSAGEGYLCLMGFNRRLSRFALFIAGTSVAAILTWYFMAELVQRLDR
jgi:hypothetical protein